MVSETRKQLVAWMETDYSKHTNFLWKVKWWLEHLGTLGTMDETAPLICCCPMCTGCTDKPAQTFLIGEPCGNSSSLEQSTVLTGNMNYFHWTNKHYSLRQQAISELPFASVSKRVLVWSLSYGNYLKFTCKWTKISVWIKLISIWKASHLDSLWNRGEA